MNIQHSSRYPLTIGDATSNTNLSFAEVEPQQICAHEVIGA